MPAKKYQPSDLLPEKTEPLKSYKRNIIYIPCVLCERSFSSEHANWLNPVLNVLYVHAKGDVCLACGIDVLNTNFIKRTK